MDINPQLEVAVAVELEQLRMSGLISALDQTVSEQILEEVRRLKESSNRKHTTTCPVEWMLCSSADSGNDCRLWFWPHCSVLTRCITIASFADLTKET